jgi:hypothetical protein
MSGNVPCLPDGRSSLDAGKHARITQCVLRGLVRFGRLRDLRSQRN